MIAVFIGMFLVHFLLMPVLMIERAEHYRLSLNQVYMAVAMAAAMMFVMHGLSVQNAIFYGVIFIAASVASRVQFLVSDSQYLKEMIQHHSMALLTSRPRVQRTQNPTVFGLATEIIKTQEQEIALMSSLE